jgi:hypothetical protein
MIVTPDAPVNAVKTAHVRMVTIASPPVLHPNKDCASQQVSGEHKQRDRHEHRRFGNAIELDDDDRRVNVGR